MRPTVAPTAAPTRALVNTNIKTVLAACKAENATFDCPVFTGRINFGNISVWDVSRITDMSFLFYGAHKFNRDLNSWDTSRVTTTAYMFYEARAFNQNLSGWSTEKVTNM